MFKKGCFELGATIYPVVIKVSFTEFHMEGGRVSRVSGPGSYGRGPGKQRVSYGRGTG